MKYLILIFVVISIGFIYFDHSGDDEGPKEENLMEKSLEEKEAVGNSKLEDFSKESNFSFPFEKYKERVIKKPFGIYITPENSPVRPERFSGFHTGTDFEILPEELNKNIAVKAVCSGKIINKRWVSGYGGVISQQCKLEEGLLSIIYGHVKLNSKLNSIGNLVNIGDIIGELGDDKSNETDGERKHLHLGVFKGKNLDFRGYVNNEEELNRWLDIEKLVAF